MPISILDVYVFPTSYGMYTRVAARTHIFGNKPLSTLTALFAAASQTADKINFRFLLLRHLLRDVCTFRANDYLTKLGIHSATAFSPSFLSYAVSGMTLIAFQPEQAQ